MLNEYKLPFTASIINAKLNAVDKKVSIEPQTLTESEKAQARANIGAVAANEIVIESVQYTAQTLTEEQKAQARSNINAATSEAILYLAQSLSDTQKNQARINIGAAPEYTYGTTDLTAGTSALENGKLHFVYE